MRSLRNLAREFEPQADVPLRPVDSLKVPKGAEVLARDEQGRPTSIAMDKYIGDEYGEVDWGDMDWDDIYDDYGDEDEDVYAESA